MLRASVKHRLQIVWQMSCQVLVLLEVYVKVRVGVAVQVVGGESVHVVQWDSCVAGCWQPVGA